MRQRIKEIKRIVEKELSCSAHNMDHVNRVYNICLHLMEDEKDIDKEVIQVAALLHDIARIREDRDNRGNTDHAVLGAEMAEPILKRLSFSEDKIKHIQDCIITHRYRTNNRPKTKEAMILFDADKLDCLGAIGIARSYMWTGKNDAKLYTDVDIDKYIKENLGGDKKGRIQDKTKHSPVIDWKTKGRFIIDKLYTDKAKEIGKERSLFFENFL